MSQHGQILFQCKDRPQSFYPLNWRWTLTTLLVFAAVSDAALHTHSCVDIHFNFSWTYTSQRNCSITWPLCVSHLGELPGSHPKWLCHFTFCQLHVRVPISLHPGQHLLLLFFFHLGSAGGFEVTL
jgi:hypothetical protein